MIFLDSLEHLIQNHRESSEHIEIFEIKSIMKQIFQGLSFTHGKSKFIFG